jgi:endonuclease/exonuclease/phosphatase family metal-dependent hydrolase
MRQRKQRSCCYLEALESRTLLSAAAYVPAGAPAVASREVTVMSQNLYMGADLAPVLSVLANPAPMDTFMARLAVAVSTVWTAQAQTNFPARAEMIADRIAAAEPDIIGLQEVSQWVLIPPTGMQDAQVTDYLEILSADLNARGMHYAPVVVTNNFSETLPDAAGDFVRLTRGNVILVNQDRPGLQVISSNSGYFTAQLVVGSGALSFSENNNWQSIDLTVGGRAMRYVNVHVTTMSPSIQELQGAELLAGPAVTNLPLVIGGDFNSDAYNGAYGGIDLTGTYQEMVDGGLTDAWTATHHQGELGLTWGPNDAVNSPVPTFNQRIDFVFTRGAVKARTMEVVGTEPALTSPEWASDHAGIVATVQLTANTTRAHQGAAQDVDPNLLASVLEVV